MARSHSLLLALVGLLVAGCSLEAVTDAAPDEPGARTVTIEQSDEAPPHSPLSRVIEKTLPSVVNVRVTALAAGGVAKGQGSGVVIDPDGIILTNFHVVQNALEVEVLLNDRRRFAGEVVGGVPEQDLAVVRVDAEDLDAITIGRSDRLKLGDDVVAIGFPLGLGGPTVTKGIVSATERSIRAGTETGSQRLQNLLQTDAAINPGNSGGALIDRAGRLVGINTAAAQAAQAENIGFAIPIDDAIPVIDEILTDPPEKQAWLGVTLADVDPSYQFQLGLPEGTEGAVVVAVLPESPAEEAGLEEGDVVVSIDGEAITSAQELIDALHERDPGDVVELRVVGLEGERTVTAELAQRPATFPE